MSNIVLVMKVLFIRQFSILKCIILLIFTLSPTFCIAQQSPLEQVENYLITKNISEDKFITALKAVSTGKYESARRKLVRKENLDKLISIAKGNDVISQSLSYLLAISSEEAMNNAEVEKGRKLYQYSNQVFDKADIQRDVVLSRVDMHPLFHKKPEKKKAPKTLIFLIIIAAGVLWLVSMLSFYKRKPKVDALGGQEKLQDLMEYFNLNKDSTIDELNKNYRAMAKSVHPDMAGEQYKDEFQMLKDKFEKAKNLLF